VRLTNKNDKRIKNLILTKKGFDILNRVKIIADEVSKKLLTGISDADLAIFRNVLMRIHENGGIEEDYFNCGLNQQK
jgi:DNA-binding MarR family transcriptional regulator